MQHAKNILLVRPASFGFNEETASSNSFQNPTKETSVVLKAIEEFDNFAETLRKEGITVHVFEDTAEPKKPDAVFPNNWISFHANGTVVLYPMFAPNRRFERRKDIIESLEKKFSIKNIIDLSHYENENKFLEGTGSIVFDHVNKVAYACLSPRTDKGLLIELCSMINYMPVTFHSYDNQGKEVYHTNVMMCMGEKFVVICLESVSNPDQRKSLEHLLVSTHHEIIDISISQMNSFAGNMLCVKNSSNENVLVLSQSAYDCLNEEQRTKLAAHCKLLPVTISTIETIGGGSARCMMAEIFLSEL